MLFWARFSQKEKIGLAIGIAFMSFALLDRVLISPINAKIKQINQQIKLSERQLATGARNASQKTALSGQYKKYIPQETKAGTDEQKIAAMLTTIEDLGRDSEVALLDIKPQATKTIERAKQYNVTVEAEGPMEALVKFFYKINHASDLLRIETLRLNLKDKESSIVKAYIQVSKIAIP